MNLRPAPRQKNCVWILVLIVIRSIPDVSVLRQLRVELRSSIRNTAWVNKRNSCGQCYQIMMALFSYVKSVWWVKKKASHIVFHECNTQAKDDIITKKFFLLIKWLTTYFGRQLSINTRSYPLFHIQKKPCRILFVAYNISVNSECWCGEITALLQPGRKRRGQLFFND